MEEHHYYITTIHTHYNRHGEVSIGLSACNGDEITLTFPGSVLYEDLSYIMHNAIVAKHDSDLEVNDRTRSAVKHLTSFLPPGKRGRKPKK
jgi:hypothetical protein